MKDILKGQNLIRLSVALFSIVLILSAFVFQFGVTDNGELTERLIHLGLYDCQGASGSGEYAVKFGVSGNRTGFTTADIPYMAAKLFHPVDSAISVFVPSAIYCILMIIGFYLIIRNLFGRFEWNNILLAVLCIFIFADTAYTSFLNTPYINAAQLSYCIFALGTLVWAVKSDKNLPLVIAGIAVALFAGTSKIAAWIGIPLAIFFLRLLFAKRELMKKVMCLLCTVIVLTSSVMTIAIAPVNENKLFDSVFYGVALNDSTQAVELGFDNETAVALSGKASFDEASQKYLKTVDISNQVSDSEIALHYLKNPSMLIENMKQVAMNSTMISTDYLGNYRYASGKGFGQTGFFKLYSTFKRRLIPANLGISLLILFAIAFGAVFYRMKYASDNSAKQICDLTVICVLSALISFVLPLIYGGLVQIGFNMFLYNLMFDLCLMSAIVGGTKLLWIRREALKAKYGVNQ